jgi:hypothetical protein
MCLGFSISPIVRHPAAILDCINLTLEAQLHARAREFGKQDFVGSLNRCAPLAR